MVGFLIFVALALTIFWFSQIVVLMRLSDDDFPGRYDKPIWAAIIVLLFVVGAAAFVVWRWSAHVDQESEMIADQLTNVVKQSGSSEETT